MPKDIKNICRRRHSFPDAIFKWKFIWSSTVHMHWKLVDFTNYFKSFREERQLKLWHRDQLNCNKNLRRCGTVRKLRQRCYQLFHSNVDIEFRNFLLLFGVGDALAALVGLSSSQLPASSSAVNWVRPLSVCSAVSAVGGGLCQNSTLLNMDQLLPLVQRTVFLEQADYVWISTYFANWNNHS